MTGDPPLFPVADCIGRCPLYTWRVHDPVHVPVLLEEVLSALQPAAGERVLDVTLGLGGHASAFLRAVGPSGSLTALDADADNMMIARRRLEETGGLFELRHVNFGRIAELDLQPFDVIFADLGLSSPHLDDATRGFSFRFEGPLDLRFDRTGGKTAADLIEASDEEDLAGVFRTYGELWKEAGKLSRALTGKRWNTTTDLKNAVEQAFGFRAKQILPQVFQALRIAVNDELHALSELLRVGPALLAPGGRMGVISFHSLEDRMVKQTFRALCEPVKDEITGKVSIPAGFELLTKKALQPSDDEIAANQRARSAKFRAIRRAAR